MSNNESLTSSTETDIQPGARLGKYQQEFNGNGRHRLKHLETGVVTPWAAYVQTAYLDGLVSVTDYFTGKGEAILTPDQFCRLASKTAACVPPLTITDRDSLRGHDIVTPGYLFGDYQQEFNPYSQHRIRHVTTGRVTAWATWEGVAVMDGVVSLSEYYGDKQGIVTVDEYTKLSSL